MLTATTLLRSRRYRGVFSHSTSNFNVYRWGRNRKFEILQLIFHVRRLDAAARKKPRVLARVHAAVLPDRRDFERWRLRVNRNDSNRSEHQRGWQSSRHRDLYVAHGERLN